MQHSLGFFLEGWQRLDYKDQDSHGAEKRDAPIFICVPQIFQSD